MATLAVTTEYRFGTIRTTFQAVPDRTASLLAKTTVVALFARSSAESPPSVAWGSVWRCSPGRGPVTAGRAWRHVAGVGLVYPVAAVIAVAVGLLIRHSAGAVSVVLVWALMVEQLFELIPGVGDAVPTVAPVPRSEGFPHCRGTDLGRFARRRSVARPGLFHRGGRRTPRRSHRSGPPPGCLTAQTRQTLTNHRSKAGTHLGFGLRSFGRRWLIRRRIGNSGAGEASPRHRRTGTTPLLAGWCPRRPPDTPDCTPLPWHITRSPHAAVTLKRPFDPTSAPGSGVSPHRTTEPPTPRGPAREVKAQPRR